MKYFACALFVVLALQATTFASHENDAVERAIADKIKEIIDSLEKGLFQIIEKVAGVIKKIEDILSSLIPQIKDKVAEEIKNIEETIQNIIDDAINAGKDVTECLNKYQEDIEELEAQAGKDGEACIQEQVDEANEILQEVKAEINSIKGRVDAFVKELTGCNTIACLTSAAGKIPNLLSEVSSEVAGIVTEVTDLLQSINNKSAVCLVNVAKEVIDNGKNIASDIKACVNNK